MITTERTKEIILQAEADYKKKRISYAGDKIQVVNHTATPVKEFFQKVASNDINDDKFQEDMSYANRIKELINA